jgi:hypothetical protein
MPNRATNTHTNIRHHQYTNHSYHYDHSDSPHSNTGDEPDFCAHSISMGHWECQVHLQRAWWTTMHTDTRYYTVGATDSDGDHQQRERYLYLHGTCWADLYHGYSYTSGHRDANPCTCNQHANHADCDGDANNDDGDNALRSCSLSGQR